MELGRKPMSLLDLCVQKVVDNCRYLGCVDGIEMELLKRILPRCTQEQLTRIESRTETDLSPVTDDLWKRFYQQQFGDDYMNLDMGNMKQQGAHYTWKELFEAQTLRRKQIEDKSIENFKKKVQAEKAEKQSKQIKLCTKMPPSSKRSFSGGGGPSSLSNSSYKSSMLKKARLEVNSRARLLSAIKKNSSARSSQTRMTSLSGQPMRTRTIHRTNPTVTFTKPIGSNRQNPNSRVKF